MKFKSFFLFTVFTGIILSQGFIPDAPPQINIFAVMVDFQEDKDNATAGNGKFGTIYSKDYGKKILDPLPHDALYFENHLLFAKNYFNKVSNGKLSVNYTVFNQIITVSKTMRNYTSLNKNETPAQLSNLAQEVWTLAAPLLASTDLTEYDLFVIFHAGTGGDVITPGSIISSRDIPSIYLSEKTLKNNFGDNFQGFQVNNKLIKNSMIIPETESREIDGMTGSSLLELSINGLIVSSIASHLGLPDLFDTETGKSSIGRFGLMDGQSIFGFSGTFLPEPSAWEKIELGWAEPVVVNPGEHKITLTPMAIAGSGDTSIVKIPINSDEYYLVERRTRDLNKDGIIFTIKDGNNVYTKKFLKDTVGFYSYNTDSLRGVIVDVDDADWALPGINDDYDPLKHGFQDVGILIWHIDEKIIRQNIEENKINLKDNRAVKLVEADGIYDIGEELKTVFGDNVILEGSRQDTWYKGNPSKFYKNVFSPDSKPNTNANDGTSSLVTISDFSSIGQKMSFAVKFGSDKLQLVLRQDLGSEQPVKYSFVSPLNPLHTFYVAGTSLYIKTGNSPANLIAENFTEFRPVMLIDTDNIIFAGFIGKKVKVVQIKEAQTLSSELEIEQTLLNKPVLISSNNLDFTLVSEVNSNNLIEFTVRLADFNISVAYISQNTTENPSSNKLKSLDIKNFILADLKNDGENYTVYTSGDKLNAINSQGFMADNFPYSDFQEKEYSKYLLSADLNNDGMEDIISITDDGRIISVSGKDGNILNEYSVSLGGKPGSYPELSFSDNSLYLNAVTEEGKLSRWKIMNIPSKLGWTSEFANYGNTSAVPAASSQNLKTQYFPEESAYNWPNPVYGSETNIRYFVSEDSKVNIKIIDISGTLVAELEDNASGGLDNETVWNVSNIQSGVYLARIKAESVSGKSAEKIIKIAIVK